MKIRLIIVSAVMLCATLPVPAFAQANPEAWAQFEQQYLSKIPELQNNTELLNNPTFMRNHPNLATFIQQHPNVRTQALDQPNPEAWSKFQQFADKVPELQRNPALVNDPTFLKNHPYFATFLKDHPNVRNRALGTANYNRRHRGQYGNWWQNQPNAPEQGHAEWAESEGRHRHDHGRDFGEGEEQEEGEHGHHDRGRHEGWHKHHDHDDDGGHGHGHHDHEGD